MSKKNSSVILKNGFKDFPDLNKIYLNFKNKIIQTRIKSFIVAISGGPDSLALAALTKALKSEKKYNFQYVLINHNIRKNSSFEAKQVKKLLKVNNINLKVLHNKIKIKNNLQSRARNLRYDLLVKYCLKKNTKSILTAHNLEDQVETFLIRLSRGSGLTGLSAMKFETKLNSKIKLCRPLLDVKKKSLEKISKKIFGRFFKDPTNTNKKYLRTKIRLLRKPLSESGLDYDQIIKSINNLASSKAILDEYYKNIFNKVVKKTKGYILINYSIFENLSEEIKIKIINDSIKTIIKNYYNLRASKVIRLISNMKDEEFTSRTLGGCIFSRKKEYISLKKEKK